MQRGPPPRIPAAGTTAACGATPSTCSRRLRAPRARRASHTRAPPGSPAACFSAGTAWRTGFSAGTAWQRGGQRRCGCRVRTRGSDPRRHEDACARTRMTTGEPMQVRQSGAGRCRIRGPLPAWARSLPDARIDRPRGLCPWRPQRPGRHQVLRARSERINPLALMSR